MKKTTLFVAALATVCACNKNSVVEFETSTEEKAVQIVGTATVENETKVTMGAKDGDVYPMSWNESGECVFLRETVRSAGTNADCGSSSFEKVDAKNAKFTFSLEAQTTESTYDYAAVYPCDPTNYKTSLDHGVRYGGEDAKNRVSYILNHTKNQVPLANAPDPLTHLMMATVLGLPAQATSLSLELKHVVGFGKMTIKNFPALADGETVSKITITVPEAQKMAGRMFHYYHENSDGSHKAGDVIPYNDSNVKNYVMIDPKNITFNTTGFDVWFTSFPISLVADDVMSLKVETSVKTYTANIKLTKAFKIEAGKVSEFIYDYEKGQPKGETKTLVFDFSSSTPLADWPNADNWDTKPGNKVCIYKQGDVDYEFILTDCQNATKARTFWSTDGRGVVMGAVYRYIGMPVLTGYKLISIACVQGTADSASNRMVGVTNTVAATSSTPHVFVGGGDSIYWTKKGDTYSYSLTDTVKDTVYYLVCTKGGAGATKITLVYEKVEE